MQDHVDASVLPRPCRRLADLPGPRPLPLLGNLHQLHRARLHQDMEHWAREYGPLFRVALGRTPMADGRRTVELVGEENLVGSITMRPRAD